MNFDINDMIKITARDAITRFSKDHFEPKSFLSDSILNLNQNGRYDFVEKYKSDNYYISNDEYFITNRIIPVNDKELIDDFIYILNKDGYRSKHFNLFDKNKNNLLTAGCSITFGVGLPSEYLWSTMLGKNLKFEHYDISYPGHSIFLIIKNIFAFIKKYGKPNKIFILFPDIHRSVYYSYEKKNFSVCTISINHLNNDLDDEIKNTVTGYNEGTQLLHIVSYIHFLESFCNLLGIDLCWTTWNQKDAEKFEKINFKNFINTNIFWPKESLDLKDNTLNKRYWNLASDKSHPGSGWHQIYYQNMIDAYNSRHLH
jgi:hypothetical protein